MASNKQIQSTSSSQKKRDDYKNQKRMGDSCLQWMTLIESSHSGIGIFKVRSSSLRHRDYVAVLIVAVPTRVLSFSIILFSYHRASEWTKNIKDDAIKRMDFLKIHDEADNLSDKGNEEDNASNERVDLNWSGWETVQVFVASRGPARVSTTLAATWNRRRG